MGSAFSGGSTSGSQNVYQPTGTAAFDQTFQNLLNQNIANNPYSTYSPQAIQTFQQQYNNPYATQYQAAAGNAGTALTNTGNAAVASAPALTQAGNTGLTAANQVLNQGFDPNNALYNRTQQQVMDQVNATNAAAGTGTSPYGSSVANAANSNFNIDWQNNQLNRALQALSGYNSGVAGASSDFSNAAALGQTGAADIAAGGAMPFNAANTITANQTDALNNLMSILGNSGAGTYNTNNLNELMSYLNLGSNQSNIQAQINQAQQQAAQQGIGSLVGAGAGFLGDIYGQ